MYFSLNTFPMHISSGDIGLKVRLATNIPKVHKSMWLKGKYYIKRIGFIDTS